jgi:SsrA-binding protein
MNMSIANNKKAFHDYFIEDRFEAGIELIGAEVKSIKLGKVSVKEAFVRIIKNEIFIMGMNVTPYEQSALFIPKDIRVRKLLLHKAEIRKIHEKVKEKGYTIVPLSVYIKKGLVKVEIAVGKGKKNYDKRDTEAVKTQTREADRAKKEFNKL